MEQMQTELVTLGKQMSSLITTVQNIETSLNKHAAEQREDMLIVFSKIEAATLACSQKHEKLYAEGCAMAREHPDQEARIRANEKAITKGNAAALAGASILSVIISLLGIFWKHKGP